MGLFGVGLGARLLAGLSGSAPLAGLAEAMLGAVTLLYLFFLVAWLAKPLRRPGALRDELQILPGRAGVAAGTLSLSLLAAVLVPYAPGLALVVVCVAVALLAGLGALVVHVLLTGPAEGRAVTPVFHLMFVGYILAPLSLVPLGHTGVTQVVLGVMVVVAGLIWGASLVQLRTRVPPAPLRPLLAIHLAPASLLAIVSGLLGWQNVSAGFAVLALAILAALLISARWLLAAGFSPLWGALTFPLAACTTAVLTAFGDSAAGLWLGAALWLAAATLTVTVAFRVFRAWAAGGLAARTNAASV